VPVVDLHRRHEREHAEFDDFAPAQVWRVTAIGYRSLVSVEIGGGGNPVKASGGSISTASGRSTLRWPLPPDATPAGPASEYEDACAVLPPNAAATVDSFGNLIIDISNLTSNE
jgi:hypothetical protein